MGMHDYITVYGKADEEDGASLVKFMKACSQSGQVFLSFKCNIKHDRTSFYGCLFPTDKNKLEPGNNYGVADILLPPEYPTALEFPWYYQHHRCICVAHVPSHSNPMITLVGTKHLHLG